MSEMTHGRNCSGNDGVGNLFCGIKNLSSCCFLVAIKFFNHSIGDFNANVLSASRLNQGEQDAIDQSGTA